MKTKYLFGALMAVMATVIYLPDANIHGNSHFMFQELNNAQIADLIAGWLEQHNL